MARIRHRGGQSLYPGPVQEGGLQCLRGASVVYPSAGPRATTVLVLAPVATTEGGATGSGAPCQRRREETLSAAGGGGGNTLPGRAGMGSTADTLPWAGQDPLAACGHRGCDESGAHRGMGERCPS